MLKGKRRGKSGVTWSDRGFGSGLLALTIGILLLAASPALASRGHIFGTPFGSRLGVGAGELNEPQGVAVNEETGNVYVADKGNNRIDEFSSTGTFIRAWGYDVVASGPDNTGANGQQTVLVKASGGKFSLTLMTANGAGNLTSGSNTVTGLSSGFGAFHEGDAITGAGIPANTTVTACSPSCGASATSLTLSATATATRFSLLSAKENSGGEATGELTEASPTVSAVAMRSGEFALGERIAGTDVPAGTGTGSLTELSPTVTSVTGGQFVVGEQIAGAGIPANTEITAVDNTAHTLTLSNAVEAGKTASGVALSAYTVVAGTAPLTLSANAIPLQQTVAVSGATGGTFKLTFNSQTTGWSGTGTLSPSSTSVTGLGTATGSVSKGEEISGPGIKPNTKISNCSPSCGPTATGLTLSQATEASAGGAQSLASDLPYNVTTTNLKEALEKLSSVGAGKVSSLTGSAGSSYVVTFANTVPGAVTKMSADASGLTGTSPAVTVTTGGVVVLSASDIPYNATEPELKAHLEALPGVGSSSLTVVRNQKTTTEFEDLITFSGGPLSHNEIPKMASATVNLEGTKSAAVSVLVPGGGIETCQAGADVCKTGTASSENGGLSSPWNLAVDNACAHHSPVLTGSACTLFDPSSGDVYVPRGTSVQKFSPSGSEIGTPITEAAEGEPLTEVFDIAVDPRGKLWIAYKGPVAFGRHVANFDDAVANSFKATCNAAVPKERFLIHGFAVDSQDNLYLHYSGNFGETFVAKLASDCTVLNETVQELEPETAISDVAVDPSTGTSYVDDRTSVASFAPNGTAQRPFGEGHLTSGTGIEVDASRETVYVADAATGAVDVFPPEPPGPPTIEDESIPNVAARSATVRLLIDPHSLPAEEPTSYRVEYGACPSPEACPASPFDHSAPVPDGTLPPDFEVHTVTVPLAGLEPGTVYHLRAVASNAHGPVSGQELIFRTQTGGAFQLPDNRAWEQVSPVHKNGAGIFTAGGIPGVVQAAASGNALTYLTNPSLESGAEGERSETTQALARRGAGGSWSSQSISPRHSRGTGAKVGTALEYRAFSSDLARAVLEPTDAAPLSEYASERTPYLRENLAEPPDYLPLLVGCPAEPQPCDPLVAEHADVSPGTEFGGGNLAGVSGSELNPVPLVRYAAASPDLTHVVVSSPVALTEGGQPGLFEWFAGQLRPIGILPDGTEAGGVIAGEETGLRGVVSADGSRVFFDAGGNLYLRYNATAAPTASGECSATEPEKACTLRLDEVQPGASGAGSSQPLFQGASANGGRVFFTDSQRLTSDSGTTGSDLYVCEILTGAAGEPECKLTDLTPQSGSESAVAAPMLTGFGQDGAAVYFVAKGVLATEPGPAGETPAAGAPNLYLRRYDAASGEWEAARLIAVLSESQDFNDYGSYSTNLSAESSPSGRYLAFMSARSLTGYDNRDAASRERDQEVYRYDAEANGGAGELTCVSCNPSGAAPAGRALPVNTTAWTAADKLADPRAAWAGASVAALLPDPHYDIGLGESASRPRAVFDNGRVAFNAAASLVPADSNGSWDVYEYEPLKSEEGAPSNDTCTAASSGGAIARSAGGCVALLSSGTATGGAAMLDAGAGGNDVFFLTRSPLSVLDEDSEIDVYDARVGGTAATRELATECLGEACQPAPNPPLDQTPASSSFEGSGNEHPRRSRCARGKVRRHGRCVAKKHRHARHRRARHNRRAHR